MSEGAKYGGLTSEFAEAFPDFGARQVAAAEQIYDLLAPYVRKGLIATVVDVGSGTGEILVELARLLRRDRSNVQLIGIDSDEDSVREAERTLAASPSFGHCQFVHCASADSLIDVIRRINGSDGNPPPLAATAILCTGHTLFHLPYLPELFQLMIGDVCARPALWLIDVYHTWDRVLQKAATQEVCEPRALCVDADGRQSVLALFTRRHETSDTTVERGLKIIRFESPARKDEPILTHQFAWSTVMLKEQFKKACYLLIHETAGSSGYGEMTRLLFSQQERSFLFPALFLDSKVIPSLKSTGVDGKTIQNSPMEIIADWIAHSGIISSNGLELVLVEVSPWYDTVGGFKNLSQEILLCSQDSSSTRLKQILNCYVGTERRLQEKSLGPFFHPAFVGDTETSEWGTVHFSLVSGSSFEEFLPREDRAIIDDWLKQLEPVAPSNLDQDFEPRPIGDVSCIQWGESLSNLLEGEDPIQKVAEYRDRLKTAGVEGSAQEKHDLKLVHMLLHKKLGQAYYREIGRSAGQTFLLGIPLHARADSLLDTGAPLPVRFRGGVWIFGSVVGEFGPRQNTLIGDLARLTAMLASSWIDTKAADAFHEKKDAADALRLAPIIGERAMVQAREAWNTLSKKVHDLKLFDKQASPPRPHEVEGKGSWEQKYKELLSCPQVAAADWERICGDQIEPLVSEFMAACITPYELQSECTFLAAVHTLKGASKTAEGAAPHYLATSAIRLILDELGPKLEWKLEDRDLKYIKIENRIGAGIFLRALHLFVRNLPTNGNLDKVRFDFEKGFCRFDFLIKFSTKEAADKASGDLESTLYERMQIRIGRALGDAYVACQCFRNATKEPADYEQSIDDETQFHIKFRLATI